MYSGKSYRRKRTAGISDVIMLCFMLIVVIAVLCVGLYRPINKIMDRRDVVCTVTDKAVKNSSDDSKYLIFTEDENGDISTYEITDSLFSGRFDSSDVYAGIKVGEKYKFTVGGSRNRFLSWYPNIYEYELINE